MRRLYIALAAALCIYGAGTALADLNYTQGSGTVLFDFLCFTTKHCSAHVLIDSSGTEKLTSGNPGIVTANLGTLNGAATAANQSTEITALQAIQTNTGAAIPAGANTIGNVGVITPAGATALTASATGTTAATTATLAGTVGKTTFVCWMSIRANATAAATGNATVTGTITGTLNFTQWTAPLASGLGVTEMIFNPCVPASATNTGIAVVSAAPGAGGTVSVSAGGYQL